MELKPLKSASQIHERVAQLGRQITSDIDGEELVVVGVLKGSFVFLADLIRQIKGPVSVEFIGVASYKGTESTGEVRITNDLTSEIRGKNVLIVEDIVDTGTTLDFLLDTIQVRQPKTLRVAAFLSKPESHSMNHKLDYIGFEISKEFVIGYGLDLDGRYRELPDLMQVMG